MKAATGLGGPAAAFHADWPGAGPCGTRSAPSHRHQLVRRWVGVRGPDHWSPSRMAILPGSTTRALRVGSGRGPTLRTAPRGARSGWMRHATGLTRLGRRDHQDPGPPQPLPTSVVSPEFPPKLARSCRPDRGSDHISADGLVKIGAWI